MRKIPAGTPVTLRRRYPEITVPTAMWRGTFYEGLSRISDLVNIDLRVL